MLRAAVEARDANAPELRLLAVTVLTSLTGAEYPEVYRDPDPAARVAVFVRAALEAGVDGVVCSAAEAATVTAATPAGFLRVTPGIRPAGGAAGDQARVATPEAALAAGATHLVLGRAVTAASDPRRALVGVLEAMARV